jgi:hypothetical protein
MCVLLAAAGRLRRSTLASLGDVQIRQIETLVADLCHGLREHFERYTIAVLPANTRARVAGQGVMHLVELTRLRAR